MSGNFPVCNIAFEISSTPERCFHGYFVTAFTCLIVSGEMPIGEASSVESHIVWVHGAEA